MATYGDILTPLLKEKGGAKNITIKKLCGLFKISHPRPQEPNYNRLDKLRRLCKKKVTEKRCDKLLKDEKIMNTPIPQDYLPLLENQENIEPIHPNIMQLEVDDLQSNQPYYETPNISNGQKKRKRSGSPKKLFSSPSPTNFRPYADLSESGKRKRLKQRSGSPKKLFSSPSPTNFKPYADLSESGKRKRLKQQYPFDKDVSCDKDMLCDLLCKQIKLHSATSLIRKIVANPMFANTILEALERPKEIKATSAEGLSLMMDCNLTHSGYQSLINFNQPKNVNILPSLHDVEDEKKKCYPKEIVSTEHEFRVPLKQLLNLTLERLCNIVPLDYGQSKDLTFMSKVGLDGSSGRTQYNVPVSQDNDSDYTSILQSAMCPLRLTDSHENILWANHQPSSCNSCRPIRIAWERETKENFMREYRRLKMEINELESTETIIEKDGIEYHVQHKIIFTMLDGKAINAITETTSASVCPL